MTNLNPIIIIPARLAATRFPNKPLKLIGGLPMVVRIMKQAQELDIAEVVVAAGDKEIYDCVNDYKGKAVLTEPTLQSGTDRVAAALDIYDKDNKYNMAVNLQGDLAVFDNEVVTTCINTLKENPAFDISTVGVLIKEEHLKYSENTAKAIVAFDETGKKGKALYFTRTLCPWGEGNHYQHLGVYAYKKAALKKFVSLKPSPLEIREKLEQLRALENNMSIIFALCSCNPPMEVNTLEDLELIEKKLNK